MQASSAPILTFLDSHVEVNEGWLQPLLRPITDDRTRVTCPVITVINQKTMQQQVAFSRYALGLVCWFALLVHSRWSMHVVRETVTHIVAVHDCVI